MNLVRFPYVYYKKKNKPYCKKIVSDIISEIPTHDLLDADGLGQSGGGTGASHVVGPHTKMQLISSAKIFDYNRVSVNQTFKGWHPFICCDKRIKTEGSRF